MPWRGEFLEQSQRELIRADGRVEVESPCLLQQLLRALTRAKWRIRQHACGAHEDIGQCATGVAEDDLAVTHRGHAA